MPTLQTLADALDEGSRSGAGYTFLDDAGPRTRSYADIRIAARQAAAGLRAAGLERGDVVALVISDAEQFLTTLLGAATAGVVPASLYPPSTTADLPQFFEATAPVLAAARARAVVTTAALVPGFRALRSQPPNLDCVCTPDECRAGLSGPPHLTSRAAIDDWRPSLDDVAFIQYTSGSTSMPKGVTLTHRSLAANVQGIHGPSGLDVTPDDVGVSWLPLYHDMGLVGMSLGGLYSGRPVTLMPPEMFVKRPVEWLRAITRYRATVSYAPNFAYDLCVRRVKDRDLDGLDLSTWRVAGCGAEPINATTLLAFADKFARVGFRAESFVPSYGLAEHVLAATFGLRQRALRIDVVSAEALSQSRVAAPAHPDNAAAIRLVSCGRPLPDHGLRIVADDGSDAGEREVGEIALCGPSVMRGYYKDPESTALAIRDGWLHTGDLGYLSEGELFVCGRLKELIVINGRKYHPQDLEWSVERLPGIKRGRVAAFGAGEPPRAVVVAEPTGTVPAALLTAGIRRTVGDLFGLPLCDVVLVPGGTIGRTTSGKVRRTALQAAYVRGELAGAATSVGRADF
jgi:fatty-acyl-CoA synthase